MRLVHMGIQSYTYKEKKEEEKKKIKPHHITYLLMTGFLTSGSASESQPGELRCTWFSSAWRGPANSQIFNLPRVLEGSFTDMNWTKVVTFLDPV